MTVAERDSDVGLDRAGLLRDLKKQVTALEDDLRERSEAVEEYRSRLEAEYAKAREAQRTAATYGAWRDERVTQAAVAWVLGCVFVRFCEDNGLIEVPYIAGPGDRLTEAEERQEQFFRDSPQANDRDWLIDAFKHVAKTNDTAAGLFDESHNPLWELQPSYEAATDLLRFWRRWDAEGGLLYDFRDGEWDTRFLGDLYQDLSDHARKTYALLQTPEFVEEFILDLTLEPAIEEFGLDPVWDGPDGEERRGLRTIDPACGSGHFLLGIFGRLVEKWRIAEPGTDDWTIVRRALESVHGCDKNPFAASIARFRLLVAAMRAAGAERLADAPAFPIHVAVGDSLLHGRGAGSKDDELPDPASDSEPFLYRTEDVSESAMKAADVLGKGSYHVVVANPPYITVADKQENENYRKVYWACSGKYALSVPFAQRIFELAIRAGGSERNGGFIGQITANSFMKREFGKVLIESFFHGGEYKFQDGRTLRKRTFAGVELTHVIDTSGAYIPGHGTPTVILVGRNQVARQSNPIRAVLGVRGEPAPPRVPAGGWVWQEITSQYRQPGNESDWVSVEDVPRASFASHPWSLSGGGAGALLQRIEAAAGVRLDSRADSLGITSFTLEDDLYLLPERSARRRGISREWLKPMVTGDLLRDWAGGDFEHAVFPYDDAYKAVDVESEQALLRYMWPCRTTISNNFLFGRQTKVEGGLKWSEYGRLTRSKLRTPLSIAFAEVATHNHFVLDRGGKIFKQTAPVIKLPDGTPESEHLQLLGLLNSSTACFWMKQVCHVKGGSGIGRGVQDELWEARYAFNATRLQEFPLPERLPLALGRSLDRLAQELVGLDPSGVCAEATPSRQALGRANAEYTRTHRRMIALQEELDWQVYGLYGLLRDDEVARVTVGSPEPTTIPEVRLGERAFEIVLARSRADTSWFDRHDSTAITKIPDRWPDWYRQIVQARIDIIESRKDIALIERPECKRRWSAESWEKKERETLRAWLLDRCEEPGLWFALREGLRQPRTLTVNQLADELRDDAELNSLAQLYAADHLKKPDLPLAEVLAEIVADEHVPYLAAMRYKESGLRNREAWEYVWDKQREEDRTGARLDIPVPPKYKSADFLKASYWSHRGKLDVPKERFISYLEASPDADPTVLLGWAGWDHKDQAQALINLIEDRTDREGWDTDRIVPLLAGLREVMPWVRQWHGEYDAEWESVPADDYDAYLDQQMAKHQVSPADLKAWRPEKKTRGRKRTAPKKAAEQAALDVE